MLNPVFTVYLKRKCGNEKLLSAMMPPKRIYSLRQTVDELWKGARQAMTSESVCVCLCVSISLAMLHESV